MEISFNIEQLLSILEYDSDNYHGIENFQAVPSASHLYRIVSRLNADNIISNAQSFVHGAYFLKTSPNGDQASSYQPIIFIAEADSLIHARENIHRHLWLLGAAPFIIVLLPDQIRVYTGFDYERKNPDQGLIDSIDLEPNLFGELSDVVIEALRDYSTRAVEDGTIWDKLRESKHVNYENRVDKRLLRNLKELQDILLAKLLPTVENDEVEALKFIHALIGKYVYLRYLYESPYSNGRLGARKWRSIE